MSLDAVHAALLASYETDGGINHLDGVNLPAQESVNTLARDYMHLLFPGYFEATALEKNAVSAHVHRLLFSLEQRLTAELEKCQVEEILGFECREQVAVLINREV